MTREQFANVLAYVEAAWPRHPITDETAAVWWQDLATYDQHVVIAAVRAVYRTGREWPPNSAHLIAEIADQTVGAPSFGEAWATITATVRSWGCRDVQRVLDRLGHPAVAALAAEVGVRQIGMAAEGDTTMHAQARERYAAILRREHRQHTHGDLPSAADPARAIGRTAPAQVAGAIGQLVERLSEDEA